MIHINAQTTAEEDHQAARPLLLLHFYCKRLETEVGRLGLEPGTPRFSVMLGVFWMLLMVSKTPYVSQIHIAHAARFFRLFIQATADYWQNPLDPRDQEVLHTLARVPFSYRQHARLRIYNYEVLGILVSEKTS